MNVNIIARHYLDQITALLYQSKELDKQDFVDSLQSFFIFSLTRLPPEIFQIFSFQYMTMLVLSPSYRRKHMICKAFFLSTGDMKERETNDLQSMLK